MLKKVLNKFILYLIIIGSPFGLTGCWDAVDVDDQNIVLVVGIDYEKDNVKDTDQYTFYTNMANFAASPKEGPIEIALIKGSGEDFLKARDALNRFSDNQIFLGSTRIVLLSQGMARKGIQEYAGRMRSDFEYRKTLEFITTKDELDRIFELKPKNSIDIGYEIERIIFNMKKNGTTIETDAGKVIQYIAAQQCGFLLHSVGIEEGSIEVNGYSIFKDSKEIGFIKAEDREGVVYLLNRKEPRFGYTLHYEDTDISVTTVNRKDKKITHVYEDKDQEMTINIEMEMEGEVSYTSKPLSIDNSIKKNLEKQLNEIVKKDIVDTIQKSQELECDYLEFYKYFRMQYPTEFKNMDWEKVYSKANVQVTINSKIVPAGMMNINPKDESR